MTERLPILDTNTAGTSLTRDSAFSYECRQCNRCCQHKRIRVNPYEVARLSRCLGLSTTQFLSLYTTEGGSELAVDAEDRCVFLTERGCGVHADRPLVCRLYPLARRTGSDGAETFFTVEPHPQSEGVYGTTGTVANFIEAQGAVPYISAVDRYLGLVSHLSHIVRETVHSEKCESTGGLASPLIDLDSAVADYCEKRGLALPSDLEQKLEYHIAYLQEFLRAAP